GDFERAVAFSPKRNVLAAVTSGGQVQLWDPNQVDLAGSSVFGRSGSIDTFAFSPNGKLIATAAKAGVRVWEASSGRALGKTFDRPSPKYQGPYQGRFASVGFMAGGDVLTTVDWNGSVGLWDPTTQTQIGPLRRHSYPGFFYAFSPGAGLVAY